MRKEFAVFAGKKIVAKFFTESEAREAVKAGQHVRWLMTVWKPKRNGTRWVKVEYIERSA